MKIYKLSFSIFFSLCTVALAQGQEQGGRNVVDTIKVFAKTPFDANIARIALEEGNSTIKGTVSLVASTGDILKGNQVTVILFPITPYLKEYLTLKKQENPKKLKFFYINPDAWKNRLEAITTQNGEFIFTKMKPGEYYLECNMPWVVNGYQDNYTGSDYNTNYYERGYYTQNYNDLLHAYVSIKKDGSIKKVFLSRRGRAK